MGTKNVRAQLMSLDLRDLVSILRGGKNGVAQKHLWQLGKWIGSFSRHMSVQTLRLQFRPQSRTFFSSTPAAATLQMVFAEIC